MVDALECNMWPGMIRKKLKPTKIKIKEEHKELFGIKDDIFENLNIKNESNGIKEKKYKS